MIRVVREMLFERKPLIHIVKCEIVTKINYKKRRKWRGNTIYSFVSVVVLLKYSIVYSPTLFHMKRGPDEIV